MQWIRARRSKHGSRTIVLSDPSTGAIAEILPDLGFNCRRFRAFIDGEPLEVIWAPEGFPAEGTLPYHAGIPVLFPFPGRIRSARFRFQDRDFQLTRRDGRGNALHGFVLDRPWTVEEQDESRVVGAFRGFSADPGLRRRWPADFRLTVAYELHGCSLRCSYRVENPDERPLPCGFGLHPYFRIPLGAGRTENCRIRVPVSACWELDQLLPTGRTRPATGPLSLSDSLPFTRMELDHVFGGLGAKSGRCRAVIEDPRRGRAFSMEFDEGFHTCVVYTPPHRRAVSIEPYTCLPDAFSLEARGIDTGLRILGPGESFSGQVEIRASTPYDR